MVLIGRVFFILGKRIGFLVYILYFVIFSYFCWLKEVKNGENYLVWKFLGVEFFVCDESFLIFVKVFFILINIFMDKVVF